MAELVKRHSILDTLSDQELMELTNRYSDQPPYWVQMKENSYRVIDSSFVEDYAKHSELMCINGQFYNRDGQVSDRSVKADIQTAIKPYCDSYLSNKVSSLFEGLKNECYTPAPIPKINEIHCTSCTLRINSEFQIVRAEPQFTLNKLNVEYNADAPEPSVWLNYLHQLLYEDDIPTLQEYLGYCLIPTTKAQIMLFIIGRGGEGKSRIGVVLQHIFQNSMVSSSLNKIQEDKFAAAMLENKLLFLDDDLKSTKLTDTDFLKSVITAEFPLMVERKGVDSYPILPYASFLAFGNKALSSCFDKSDGFYRRQLTLTCRPRPKDRVDDPNLSEKLLAEKEGIFNWMLEGLLRLLKNGYQFTKSELTERHMQEIREADNNVLAFLKDEDFVSYAGYYDATSREIYDCYVRWCSANAEIPLAERTVINFLKESGDQYDIKYQNHIQRNDRRPRGFKGIKVKTSEGFSTALP